jgi:hypothetical protein
LPRLDSLLEGIGKERDGGEPLLGSFGQSVQKDGIDCW